MANVDKLMGIRGETNIYGAYRIDYDSEEDIRYIETEETSTSITPDEEEVVSTSVTRQKRFTGAAKSPPPEHPDHPVKDGFLRKIVVEDGATRDEVTDYLDSEGIDYTVEDISPTSSEIDAIESYGATNEKEVEQALIWSDALSTASSVDDMKDIERGVHPGTGEEFDRPPESRR